MLLWKERSFCFYFLDTALFFSTALVGVFLLISSKSPPNQAFSFIHLFIHLLFVQQMSMNNILRSSSLSYTSARCKLQKSIPLIHILDNPNTHMCVMHCVLQNYSLALCYVIHNNPKRQILLVFYKLDS